MSRTDARLAAAVALSVIALAATYTHVGLTVNDGSRYCLAQAIALDGSFEIGARYLRAVGTAGAIDKISYEGRVYSDKAPLGSFLAAPVAWLANALGLGERAAIYACSLAIAAMPAGVACACVFLVARSIGATAPRAVFASLALGAGTNLLYWSTLMFSHALSAALVVASYALVRRGTTSGALATAGLVGGLGVASDYYVLLLLPGLGLYVLARHGWRKAIAFGAGAAVAGVVPALYHHALYGQPLVLPYRYHATFSFVHDAGFYGISVPRQFAVLDILVGKGFGLCFWNPVFLVSFAALPGFVRRHRADGVLLVGSLAVLLWVGAGHTQVGYGYGWSWGPRYLVPLYPLLVVPLALAPWGRGARYLAAGLAALSIALNLATVQLYHQPEMYEAHLAIAHELPRTMAVFGGLNVYAQVLRLAGRTDPLGASLLSGLVVGALAGAWTRWAWRHGESRLVQAAPVPPPTRVTSATNKR